MPLRKSESLLPGVFRTNTNRRFLNATVDQLIQEPRLGRVFGYIGRQDNSPAFKADDSYVREADVYSQYYQLEPSVVTKAELKGSTALKISSVATYLDLLNQIAAHGGINNNHSRLFDNEYYNYEGFVDLDKLVNFNKYYWAPMGTRTVEVTGQGIDMEKTFAVNSSFPSDSQTVAIGEEGYFFEGFANKNPKLVLARGGTYQFDVAQLGHGFYVQTTPGLTTSNTFDLTRSRDVLGVSGNGTDIGSIIFRVPFATDQDRFVKMTEYDKIDLVTDLRFDQINNQVYSEFIKSFSLDGVKMLQGKRIVINNTDNDGWYLTSNYDGAVYEIAPYDRGVPIPQEQRKGIWLVTVDPEGVIRLTYEGGWPVDTKLYVKQGTRFARSWIYKNSLLDILPVPNITAPLTKLYYQDSLDSTVYGEIDIVDPEPEVIIYVDKDILGATNYTSPNGAVFTNGLKIVFGGAVIPESYRNETFVVEGVGRSIRLVKWADLVTPEPYNQNLSDGYAPDSETYDSTNYEVTYNAPTQKDYLTVNRSSLDGNAWSRGNRWVHVDVLRYADAFNNVTDHLWTDEDRARRPIIEFDADLQLMNYGQNFLGSVFTSDIKFTDALNQVEGQDPSALTELAGTGIRYVTDDVELLDGVTCVFMADNDKDVARTIFRAQNIAVHSDTRFNIVLANPAAGNSNIIPLTTQQLADVNVGMAVVGVGIPGNARVVQKTSNSILISAPISSNLPSGTTVTFRYSTRQVHLVKEKQANVGDVIVIESGILRQGNSYTWNGDAWEANQTKVSVNYAPMFDVVDTNGVSFSDQLQYPGTSFVGSRLFGYLVGTATTVDTELGFALTYRSLSNMGDIQFANHYDAETFIYSNGSKSVTTSLNRGFVQQGSKLRNGWTKVAERSHQLVERVFIAEGNKKNDFDLSILFDNSTTENTIFVAVNGVKQAKSAFTLLKDTANASTVLHFVDDLPAKARVHVKARGLPRSQTQNIAQANLYTLPKNLELNPFNETFSSVTLGQMRGHVQTIAANSLQFKGDSLAGNNLRDLDYKTVPGQILQHSAPVAVSSLLVSNNATDIIAAIDYSRRQYGRFRDQLIQMATDMELSDPSNPRQSLDEILNEITSIAGLGQSFYLTDMLPHSRPVTVNRYKVAGGALTSFNLANAFDANVPSYKAVLVYLNGTQLVRTVDYNVENQTVQIIHALTMGDIIEIVEYADTKGCMVPATPSKLGLFPAVPPRIERDTTYIDPQDVIIGHDGSVTVTFGDHRDNILLEYEKRVYNNIKVNYNESVISYTNVEPGAFRSTDYNVSEWTQLLSGSFLSWAGSNSIDVFSNTTISNDPFTYNYAAATDKLFGEPMPAGWRGAYKYFYDTDKPHSHPWEMLGYVAKPTWWEEAYGPAPYSSANTPMWKDLEQGVSRDPKDPRVIPSRARPGLSTILPVDNHGNLLAPLTSLASVYDSSTSDRDWRFGDQSPQETAWRRGPDYPFAVQIAWALAKPAEYCALSVNTYQSIRIAELDQIVNRDTLTRSWGVYVNTEKDNVPGSNVWVQDRLNSLGMDIATVVPQMFANCDINLVYKMAGFTDKQYVEAIADQASPQSTSSGVVIPNENYHLTVTKSAPIARVTYSAVVVQKTGAGYELYGFDLNRPYFTIIPSVINNNFFTVKAGKQTGLIYKDASPSVMTIPYGTVMSNLQQVVDFLTSYGRWLTAQGFVFDSVLQDSATVQDWALSAKEFLWWAQLGFDDNTVISVTPAASKIKFTSDFGTVDDLTNSYSGTRVINSDGLTLTGKDYHTYRDGTDFEVTLRDNTKGVHLIDLEVVQFEHSLIFDNTTVFSDVIYDRVLGNRQSRIKVQGYKTRDWNGSIYAPGFLVNYRDLEYWQPWTDYHKGDIVIYKNQRYTAQKFLPGNAHFDQTGWYILDSTLLDQELIPNPAFNAAQFTGFYDVDTADVNTSADLQARNATGFVPRTYFDDLGMDVVSQHKFYLGMIREKGTSSAVSAFLRGKLPHTNNDVTVVEQWAVRLGEYGGTSLHQDVELGLGNAKVYNNSYIFQFVNETDAEDAIVNSVKPSALTAKPLSYEPNMFAATTAQYGTVAGAGPVGLSEVRATVFDINKINNISGTNLREGDRIWVAADVKNEWAMLRVCQLAGNSRVTASLTSGDANEIIFVLGNNHGLQARDLILLKKAGVQGTNLNLNGFYRVKAVTADRVSVAVPDNVEAAFGPMNAEAYVLKRTRYADGSKFAADMPARGWVPGDVVWLDKSSDGWQVLRNSTPWTYKNFIAPVRTAASDMFGSSMQMSRDQSTLAVGAPYKDAGGYVYFYGQEDDNGLGAVCGVAPADTLHSGFGYAVAGSDEGVWAVGAPNSGSNRGAVYIINEQPGNVEFEQVLYSTTWTTGSKIGSALAMSNDGEWLYIGAPGVDKVYVYVRNAFNGAAVTYFALGTNANFEVPAGSKMRGLNPDDFTVKINQQIKTPFVDYIVHDEQIVFTVTPAENDEIEIAWSSRFKFHNTISSPYANGAQFGATLATNDDGSQLYVGAPNYTWTDTKGNAYAGMGAVVVYDRTYESFFYADNIVFATANAPLHPSVKVDGVPADFRVAEGLVVLKTVPAVDAIVEIDTNAFVLVQELLPSIAQKGLAYGTSISVSSDAQSVYVGAPGARVVTDNNGVVFKHIDLAERNGKVSTTAASVYTPGHKVRFNGFAVDVGASATAFARNINAANIPNVSAKINSGIVEIVSSVGSFSITSDVSSVLTELAIKVLPVVQTIAAPRSVPTGRFGTSVSTNSTGDKLAVGATVANNKRSTQFDSGRTSYDSKTTLFRDSVYRSGAVMLFEYQPSATDAVTDIGLMVYGTTLVSDKISTASNFGASVVQTNNYVVAASPQVSLGNLTTGAIHVYLNSDGSRVWQTLRKQPNEIDSNLVQRVYIYNSVTGAVQAELPVLDPKFAKLGPDAIQQIDFTTSYDPAVYSDTPNTYAFTNDPKNAWGQDNVGKIWWDINSVKYFDSNVTDPVTAFNLWGRFFPSSKVSVMQWIASDVVPSEFAKRSGNSGIKPLYQANDVFCKKQVVQPDGRIAVRYYFWVVNNTVAINNDVMTASEIQSHITDIRNTSLPFAAVLNANTIALFNCTNYVDADSTLHLTVNRTNDTIPTHQEWAMFDDGTDTGTAAQVVSKILDSMAGQDAMGRNVPDLNLPERQRYGTANQPRQSVFNNKVKATKVWVDTVNSILARYPIALLRDIESLRDSDPLPSAEEYDIVFENDADLGYVNIMLYDLGTRVLVKSDSTANGDWTLRKSVKNGVTQNSREWRTTSISSYNCTRYWSTNDWYAEGYDVFSKPRYTIDREYELSSLPLLVGDTVLIKNSNAGGFKLVLVKDNTLELVGQQDATVQFSTALYDVNVSNHGFEDLSFENFNFAQDSALEMRILFNAVNNSLLTGDLRKEYKALLEALIIEMAQQFTACDWLMKTSLMNVAHNVRELDQYPVYVKSPENAVLEYLNEAKPYHAKVKEYLASYNSTDVASLDSTDFDLPPYYNVSQNAYRSPQLGNGVDEAALNLPVYESWFNNHTYSIESIVIVDGGHDYEPEPLIMIEGDGEGASARSIVIGGVLKGIIIDKVGKGYTWARAKVIGQGNDARLAVSLTGSPVRTLKTTMKFDRYVYNNDIQDWAEHTHYNIGDLVVYQGQPWRFIANVSNSGTQFDPSAVIMHVQRDWRAFSDYDINDVVVHAGEAYIASSSFTSSDTFNTMNLVSYTGKWINDAMNRAWAYYEATKGMPGRDLAQLFDGIEFPGVKVVGPTFEQDPGYDVGVYEQIAYDSYIIGPEGVPVIDTSAGLDTIYKSTFIDTALGARPEDIITSGGMFVDPAHSHAPQELVPGRAFDTLSIKVTNLANTQAAFAPNWVVVAFNGDGAKTTFKFVDPTQGFAAPKEGIDKVDVYVDARGPSAEGVNHTVDWTKNEITFAIAPPAGSTVYVTMISSTGLNVVYDGERIGDGVTTDFRMDDYNSEVVQQAYVKVNGVRSTNWALTFDNDRPVIQFGIAPTVGSVIQIHLYNLPLGTKAYMEATETTKIITANTPVYPADWTVEMPVAMVGRQPLLADIIVRVDGSTLTPSNQAYYVGNGSTVSFDVSQTVAYDSAQLADSDVIVTVDGIRATYGIDYIVERGAPNATTFSHTDPVGAGDGVDSVIFNTAPAEGAFITVSNINVADYRLDDQNTVRLMPSVSIVKGSRITVEAFSTNAPLDSRVQVFTGLTSTTSTSELGWDETSWDISGFENDFGSVTVGITLHLSRAVKNYSFLTLTKDGVPMSPYTDFVLSKDGMSISFADHVTLTDTSTFIVRHNSEAVRSTAVQWRVFKNMWDRYSYTGISEKRTTLLTQPATFASEWLYLKDVTKLDVPDPTKQRPGVVFIAGERITYYQVDTVNNRIGQLRRGTHGTGAAEHAVGTLVENAGYSMIVPFSDDTYETSQSPTQLVNDQGAIVTVPAKTPVRKGKVWTTLGSGTPADGKGFAASTTVQANFLKGL